MPSLADQINTLEMDHTAALAHIDGLNATNAALTSANTSLQTENAALQAQCSDMKHQVDDVRQMADSLARSALDMLRASRQSLSKAPVDWNAITIAPFSPALQAKIAAAVAAKSDEDKLSAVAAAVLPIAEPIGGIDRASNPLWKNALVLDTAGFLGSAPIASPLIVGELPSDSGDEQPDPLPLEATHEEIEEQDASNANALSSQAAETGVLAVVPPIGFTHCSVCADPPSCIGVCKLPLADVEPPPETSADAMKARLGQPMFVVHDNNDLPIFLRPEFAPAAHVFG